MVDGCNSISTKINNSIFSTRIIASDTSNDISLLQIIANQDFRHAVFRAGKGIRIGNEIVVVGFPFGDMLGSNIKVTTGNVSSLTGLLNDSTNMQISAPVQPGNSGGPLLDRSGNIVGVVSSKLNAFYMTKSTGFLPQNVNFAIKSNTIQSFLDAHNVDYHLSTLSNTLDVADIADSAKNYVVKVSCD